jgi:uncharacterized membrane protein
VIVWVAIMLPTIFLPIVGLTMDAGMVFDARRDLQNAADGAARVAAMEINVQELYARPGSQGAVRILQQPAREAVADYLERVHFVGNRAVVTFPDNGVQVRLSRPVRTWFLRLAHIDVVTISATGRAVPCSCISASDVDCS